MLTNEIDACPMAFSAGVVDAKPIIEKTLLQTLDVQETYLHK